MSRSGVSPTWLVLLPLLVGLAGCSFYSFRSGRSAAVSSIGIPLFENQTAEYGLAEQLTEGITAGLIKENIVKVVDPSRAESTLKAAVVSYKRSAYTFDAGDNVREYIVEITIRARLAAAADDKVIWEAPALRGFGVYAADSETEQDGQSRAIDKLTQEIVNRTAKGW